MKKKLTLEEIKTIVLNDSFVQLKSLKECINEMLIIKIFHCSEKYIFSNQIYLDIEFPIHLDKDMISLFGKVVSITNRTTSSEGYIEVFSNDSKKAYYYPLHVIKR